jgi:hypothetical protein
MALLLLADSLVPWERYCADASDGFPARCFSARLWSGSASLLGILAILLFIAFLASSFRTSLRIQPGSARLALFGGALAAIVSKVLLVGGNDGITSENQSFGGPAWVGVWIGLLLALIGVSLLAAALWRATSRPRSLVIVVVVMLAVMAVAIPYAGSGLAWWGGPLAEPAYLGGGNGVGMIVEPDRPEAFASLLYFRNLGAVPVTFDGLDLLEASPPITVLGAYAITSGQCTPAAVELEVHHRPDGCAYPLEGFRFQPGGIGHNVLLAMVVEVPEPGLYRSGWFRVRYHSRPLPFEVFRTDMLTICAPEPGRERCPGY